MDPASRTEQKQARASHRFCPVEEVTDGKAHSRMIAGLPVGVCLLDGRLCAFSALCPHLKTDLSAGIVGSGGITCPDHLWHFDLCSGKCTMGTDAELTLYPVREEDGWIVVDLPA